MISHRAEWIGMLTSVCVVLGGLLALTIKTQQQVRAGVPAVNNSVELDQEWGVLQHKILTLQNDLARLRGHTDSAPERTHFQMLAAMSPVVGPGIAVTLSDNPNIVNNNSADSHPDPMLSADLISAGIIHDVDILRVVNELFAAGAEAVAVNGQRIGPRTAIRCVGPVVNVNQVGCASPFKIEAVGNPETLQGALDLPGGEIESLKGVQCGVTILQEKKLLLPAYDGAVQFMYAHPLKLSRKDQGQQ
ncbi:MAG TPA: DUF881 domain-containing protein [Armatimonadota bacterium]|nr:DUF881 domain-containing protein [Armatimonadota bacterium]